MADRLVQQVTETLRRHLPRDRYDEDGISVATYCTCGSWTGGYFADGEAGPYDVHLAEAVVATFRTYRRNLPVLRTADARIEAEIRERGKTIRRQRPIAAFIQSLRGKR